MTNSLITQTIGVTSKKGNWLHAVPWLDSTSPKSLLERGWPTSGIRRRRCRPTFEEAGTRVKPPGRASLQDDQKPVILCFHGRSSWEVLSTTEGLCHDLMHCQGNVFGIGISYNFCNNYYINQSNIQVYTYVHEMTAMNNE